MSNNKRNLSEDEQRERDEYRRRQHERDMDKVRDACS